MLTPSTFLVTLWPEKEKKSYRGTKMKKNRTTAFFLSIVFFNSFVDLGHKIIIQNSFYATSTPAMFTTMSAIINAMILLPYLIMFMPAGFLADRFSKTKVMRYTAVAAIPLTVMITIFYYQGAFWPAFIMTLLLGIQSALNSPAKYGFIKEYFGEEKLTSMNGLVQAIVILAIMAGSFVFSVLFQHYFSHDDWSTVSTLSKSSIIESIAPVGFLLIISSILEAWFTWHLPVVKATDPHNTFDWKGFIKFSKEREYLKLVYNNKDTWAAVVGLASFWGVGQVLLANYGAFLKEYVANPSPSFVQGTLAMGSLGILLGAIRVGRISKNYIETGLIPAGALGVCISLLLLPSITNKVLILIFFLGFGYFGGLLIVPLNALIQYNSKGENLGKVLSANNFIQNLVMLTFLIAAAFLSKESMGTIPMMYGLFIVTLLGTGYAIYRLPQSMARYITRTFLSMFYHIDVEGLDHIPSEGGALLLGNHTSFLDWAIIQTACPRPVHFVMERSIYNKWYFRWLLKRLSIIPISSNSSKDAIRKVGEALDRGELVALFPEGYITRNGHLGNFQRGFETILKDRETKIIPFYLHGLWGTVSSYAEKRSLKSTSGRLRRVSIYFGEHLPSNLSASDLKRKIMDLSYHAWLDHAKHLPNIASHWLKRAKIMKNEKVIIDNSGTMVSAHQSIGLVWSLKSHLSPFIRDQKNIGIMLPPSLGGILANLTLLAKGKTLVNLNYTASKEAFAHMLKKADIKTVITSKLFLKKLSQKGLISEEDLQTVHCIYLEEVFAQLSKIKILFKWALAKICPTWFLSLILLKKTNPENTAAILFSSGSEGLPKGVELTHRNIMSNVEQVTYSLNISEDDVMISCLPLFHATGLTVTTLLPLLDGTPLVCYPDPTDVMGVAKSISQYNVTILCTTPTLFNLYTRNKKCHPLMLQSLRLCVSGAEKLPQSIRENFKAKFHVDILQGYGTTECTPIVSANLPDILIQATWHIQKAQESGSVGMPLPGTRIRILNPETFEELPLGEEGLVAISGPQIMKGYLDEPEKNKKALLDVDGAHWYLTWDKGYINEEGFLFIVDRYARFAKIAGEMISLASVENSIRPLLTEQEEIAAVSIPDEKKGERVVLLHTVKDFDTDNLKKTLLANGLNNLLIPSEFIYMDNLPKLGSGKIDLVSAKKFVLTQMSDHDEA